MTLVSTEWLNNNLNKVQIFDASWHMPNSKRNAKKEYSDNILMEHYFGILKNTVTRTHIYHICFLTQIIGPE